MKKERRMGLHPAILDYQTMLQKGRMSRREFLRLATLLGASIPMAYSLAGCKPKEEAVEEIEIRRGGRITIGSSVQLIDHPARLEWVEAANQLRQVAEYLTLTDEDNMTEPWLLEQLEVDDDVKTWTLHLRRNIQFNDGQPFTADDVMFNFQQWLDPAINSSMLSLLSYLSMSNIEKVDDYTVRLHLNDSQIGVPEHLFHYPALIVPHTFEGDFLEQPIGTGPFTLEEYVPGEIARLKRREDYWKMGEDGRLLPYLDELIYLDLLPDNRLAAMQGGLIDTLYVPRPEDWQALQYTPNVKIHPVRTAQTFVLRMRADQAPWQDVRVRQALKLCQDRNKILETSYFGQGVLAMDAHISPVHPEYCALKIPEYDPERAKALLAEAGYPDGLTVTLTTKNDQGEPVMAQTLRDLAKPGGFNIKLNIVEPARYWEQWTQVNLGITTWAHRPLGVMVLALGYITDDNGEPVPWNETHWQDDEFVTLFQQAVQTLDIEKRREIMCRLQEIMQERGPIGISYWRDGWLIIRDDFQNVRVHPTGYDLFFDLWRR